MKDIDNLEKSKIVADEELGEKQEYENGSPAKKVTIILGDEMMDSLDLAEARNIAKDYEKLYDNAHKAEATAEDKENFAATAVLMQNSLKNCLANLNKNNPDAFSKDPNVANLYAAYSENSHATVKALQEAGGNVFTALIKNVHAEAEKNKKPWNEDERRRFEDNIAKLMYLSYLKYEYEHVSGTEEEKNAWRSEILTELISDKFEENIEKFKDNPLCSEVIKHHKNIMKDYKDGKINDNNFPGINDTIFQAFHNRADSDYQSIYPLVYNGIRYKSDLNGRDPKEIAKVKDTVKEIDMMKALYKNVFEVSTGNVPVDIDRDPVFDTLYMKRSSRVNGQQLNYAKMLNDNKNLELDYEEDLRNRKERYKNDKLNLIKNLGEMIGNKVVIDYVSEYVDIPKNIKSLEKMMDIEKAALESINDAYWKKYEEDYFKKNKKNIKPKALAKAKEKKGAIAVNEEAEEKIKIINDYTESIAVLKKRREKVKECLAIDCKVEGYKLEDCISRLEVYKKEIAQLSTNIKNYEQTAIKDAKATNEAKRNEKKRISDEVNKEGLLYEQALKDNDIEAQNAIKAKREKRDEELKKYGKAEFECVKFNNKTCYVARNIADTVSNIRDDYKKYITTYKKDFEVKENEQDKKANYDNNLEKSLAEYEAHEKENCKEPSIPRSDRSNIIIKQFNVEVAPEMAIAETDINNIQVDLGILKPGVDDKVVDLTADVSIDIIIKCALNEVEKTAFTFRQGSPEYKAIQDGLKEIKKLTNGKDNKLLLDKCRNMVAIMDQYIGRKQDEADARDKRGVNKRAVKRKNAVMIARAFVKGGISHIEKATGLDDKDFTPEEVSYQLEFSAGLKKVKDSAVNEIIETLRNGDRLDAQKKMQDYLADKVNKYKNEDGKYTFKLHDEDDGKRLPEDKDERMFAIMLKSYEKLAESNLAYYQYENVSKLPELIESIEHFDFKGGIEKSVNDVFGVKILTVGKRPEYNLKRTDNALDYAKQFDENYKCGMAMLTNNIYKNGAKLKTCMPGLYLTEDIQKNLLDNAFSNLYLKAIHDSKTPFNFDEVDVNRRKILTVIHNTPIIENIGKSMEKYFNIANIEKITPSQLHEVIDMKKRMVIEPISFNKLFVSEAISLTAEDALNEVTDLLSQKNYSRDEMSAKLGLLDLTIKIAKEVGMTHVLDKLNQTKTIPYKGKTFADTIKKIQHKVNDRNIKKQIEPAKGVKL